MVLLVPSEEPVFIFNFPKDREVNRLIENQPFAIYGSDKCSVISEWIIENKEWEKIARKVSGEFTIFCSNQDPRYGFGKRATGGPIVNLRAKLQDLIQGLTVPQFVDAVIQERSWELFAEADRWYDLTRTGKFLTLIPLATNNVFPTRTPQPKHRFFPIPLDEVMANPNLEQNPDWN
jgi:hypothetical protein